MSPCENLPQELILAIADNLQEDKKSLKDFSLVCKAWTDPAREHLFTSLNIFSLRRLEEIIAANIASTYTPFLRKLSLSSLVDPPLFWRNVIPFLANFTSPRLRSLVLDDFAWRVLSPDQRSAFFRRFESITFLQMSLYNRDISNDVATIICSLPQLRSVLLLPSVKVLAFSRPSHFSPALRLPERLSTLCVYYYDEDYGCFLEWLGSIPGPLPIRNFRLIRGRLRPYDRDPVNSFLKALGPSLEHFRCDHDVPGSINLTYNTHLRHLDYRVGDLNRFSLDLSPVISLLHQIKSRQFKQITLRCNRFFWEDWNPAPDDTKWSNVDAILAQPQFATLKHIRISGLPLGHAMSALFATLLPTCHARGIISFVDPPSW